MTKRFKIGDQVRLDGPALENECYDKLKDNVLTITHVATSTKQHPGYDNGTDAALYDFAGCPCSLYDWELTRA